MIRKAVKRGLLPAIGVTVVIAAAVFAPTRAVQITESLKANATCYAYPTCAIYTTDAFGPLHEDQRSPVLYNYPVFGSGVVRAAHYAPAGTPGVKTPYSGLILDAYGGLHPYSPKSDGTAETSNCDTTGTTGSPHYCAPASAPLVVGQAPYYPGQDLARDFVFNHTGTGGYEIDAYGGIHPFSLGANPLPPQPAQYPYYPGNPVAKKITILADDSGGYELDAFGGVHPWSVSGSPLPAQIVGAPYYPGNPIARDLWLDPASTTASSSGYELDGYGGFHPWWAGAAPRPTDMGQYPYYPGNDIARIMWFQPNASSSSSTGYQLDGYGGVHPFCTADNQLPPAFTDYPYWPGRDIARALFGST